MRKWEWVVDVVADGWALLSQEMIAESINCINCYLKKHCSFPRGYLLNGWMGSVWYICCLSIVKWLMLDSYEKLVEGCVLSLKFMLGIFHWLFRAGSSVQWYTSPNWWCVDVSPFPTWVFSRSSRLFLGCKCFSAHGDEPTCAYTWTNEKDTMSNQVKLEDLYANNPQFSVS